jgi:hypothetical protein
VKQVPDVNFQSVFPGVNFAAVEAEVTPLGLAEAGDERLHSGVMRRQVGGQRSHGRRWWQRRSQHEGGRSDPRREGGGAGEVHRQSAEILGR